MQSGSCATNSPQFRDALKRLDDQNAILICIFNKSLENSIRTMSEFESNELTSSRGDVLSAIEGWLAHDMDGFASLCRLREAVGMRSPEMYVLVER